MTVSRREAVEMLDQADRAERAVARKAPKEYAPFIGWALFNAVVIPGFDLFDRAAWGWVTAAIAVAGVAVTFAYFMTRSVQVEVRHRSPWWVWPVLGLWVAATGMLASVLDGELAFAYTLAGLIGAVPMFAWGLSLRRRV